MRKKIKPQEIVDSLNDLLDAAPGPVSRLIQNRVTIDGKTTFKFPKNIKLHNNKSLDILSILNALLDPLDYTIQYSFECDQHKPRCIAYFELIKRK